MSSFSPLVFLSLAACATGVDSNPRPQTGRQASVQRLRAGTGESGTTYVGMSMLATDEYGAVLACSEGRLEVTVSYAGSDGTFHALPSGSVVMQCANGPAGDLALVVDNSGSEHGYTEELQQGASLMADAVLAAGGRVSVTRVSTDSETIAPLTRDATVVDAALGGLEVRNGWTALYDGIRMGNEAIGMARMFTDTVTSDPDVQAFCDREQPLGIVAFTDGMDNNSDSSQAYDHAEYPGDGFDTTMDDLHNLKIGTMTTPIYTLGLGNEVDHESLTALATATGGRHVSLDGPDEIVDAYSNVEQYFAGTQQVCAEVPEQVCGDLTVRVEYSWEVDGSHFMAKDEYPVYIACPIEPDWRTVTALVTMDNDPGLGDEDAGRLAQQTVRWVSGMTSPKVLVVLDDNHHNEQPEDAAYVQSLLQAAGLEADYMDEPTNGLEDSDLEGYNAVWFTNPGYPMDDIASFYALAKYADEGGGLVIQGDDMSASQGNAWDMSALTHLRFLDNGTWYCGLPIDNNSTSHQFRVHVGVDDHPVTQGVSGEFLYGNDIDITDFVNDNGANTLATAVANGGEVGCPPTPVIVAYDPP
jgi:hypothetical protein